MKEIKFRAWDEGCMLGPMGLQLSDSAEWIYNLTNDAILMQYTGMKDKNGVEIYEGDIIEGSHDFGPGGFVRRKDQVSFHPELGYLWDYWVLPTLEVIGNVHENPELLTKDSKK